MVRIVIGYEFRLEIAETPIVWYLLRFTKGLLFIAYVNISAPQLYLLAHKLGYLPNK